ncbi:MAG: hypothetical protein PHW53_02820 [Patescibacteria group bacterium]|nr:hypothetical protein [Patescibacteria group bacterium]
MPSLSRKLVLTENRMMASVLKQPISEFFREAKSLSRVPHGSEGERLASKCDDVLLCPEFAALPRENANNMPGRARGASATEVNKIALMESAFQAADDPVLKGWKTPYMRRWRKSAVRHCNCGWGG